MSEPSTETQAYKRAKDRVKAVREFWGFLAIYVFVNAIVITVNLLSSPDTLWFYWVSIGMAIPLVIIGFQALIAGSRRASTWEDRKLDKYLEQERGRPLQSVPEHAETKPAPSAGAGGGADTGFPRASTG